eukprot:CAMPEP_0119337692 /NCGR_PEP_ID=MMETSP1333-20130426/94545_1 /TAXON_ID=418940 /ORGANISM="Scyphosphaera apsteinii, Strain RCC1455" /LENGTH=112 /DNA_ID=CAMNT_0007348803 /DNA_START=195 /DNA_END=535 /DNA_ORIENTATION=-
MAAEGILREDGATALSTKVANENQSPAVARRNQRQHSPSQAHEPSVPYGAQGLRRSAEVLGVEDETAWDDKVVDRRGWVLILERKQFAIVIEHLRRCLATQDAAEDVVGILP